MNLILVNNSSFLLSFETPPIETKTTKQNVLKYVNAWGLKYRRTDVILA